MSIHVLTNGAGRQVCIYMYSPMGHGKSSSTSVTLVATGMGKEPTVLSDSQSVAEMT